jgi:hypothetical protein
MCEGSMKPVTGYRQPATGERLTDSLAHPEDSGFAVFKVLTPFGLSKGHTVKVMSREPIKHTPEKIRNFQELLP